MQLPIAATILGLSEGEIAILISGVALIFALRRWRQITVRNRTHPTPDAPTPEANTVNPLSARELTAELSALLAELEETTRRVVAQMSNRRAALELLLKEADEKIHRLESLARDAPDHALPEPQPKASSLSAPPDPAQTLSRLRKQRGAPVPAEDPAYRPIYQLADQGKNSREIAQALGRQPGEVELILALRARQGVG